MKYLKLFNNHTAYETFESGGTMVKPNVSHCIQENEVHYNPRTWADEYLTFEALEDGTFSFNQNDLQYSVDEGDTWETLAAGQSTTTIASGSKVMWKAENPTITSGNGIGNFS